MTVKPFPLDPRYAVSDTGKIYGLKGQPLKPQTNNRWGYQIVFLTRARRMYVHRVVALTFIGEPGDLHVDHINNDPRDNRLSNLRYVTPAENMRAQVSRNTKCRKGHPYENNETWAAGHRRCTICMKAAMKAYEKGATPHMELRIEMI